MPHHGLEAVLVAAELALEAGKPSGEHVLNVLARLKGTHPAAHVQQAVAHALGGRPLTLREEPQANVQRYEALRAAAVDQSSKVQP